MLERAAGCFETAGRLLLRDSQGKTRSRRSLSRHFWRHNTTEGDVARWFFVLTQLSASRPSTAFHTSYGQKSTNNAAQPFLDFLYPQNPQDSCNLKTDRHSKRPGSRRRKKGIAGFRRNFTSVATALHQTTLNETPTDGQALHEKSPVLQSKEGLANFRELLASKSVPDFSYDKAWVTYLSLGRPPEARSDLCAYLSQSDKTIDRERTWEIFGEIPPESRSHTDFYNVCQSQLRCTSPKHLTNLLQQALSAGVAVDHCFEISFIHYLRRHEWAKMQEVWAMRFGHDTSQADHGLTQLAYPNLPYDLLALTKFVQDSSIKSRDTLLKISGFLLDRITKTGLLLEKAPLDVLLETFSLLHQVHILKRRHFRTIIHALQKATSRITFARSIAFYRQMRSLEPLYKPRITLLNAQMVCLEKFNMTDTISSFMDEYTSLFGKPPSEAYKISLNLFARAGMALEVNQTFERFIADHGKPKSRKLVIPLLIVHASNGDIENVWAQFRRLKRDFNMQPSRACWNIVLEAYAKARNIPGAFYAFRKMDAAGVEPDAFTFSILMGLVSIRGDIDGVRRLLKLAEERHVEITMPMLGKVISAYVNNGYLDIAEQLTLLSLELNLPGSPTPILNSILMRYVFMLDNKGYYRILRIMDGLGMPPNPTTHAARLIRFCLTWKPTQAHILLRKLHKSGVLHATQVDYAIVMLGYVKNRQYEQARVILRETLARFPGSALEDSLSKIREFAPYQGDTPSDETLSARFSEDFFINSLVKTDLTHLFSKLGELSGMIGKRSPDHSNDVAGLTNIFLQTYHRQLIKQYGDLGKVDEAESIYSRQLATEQEREQSGKERSSTPLSLLHVMMKGYLKAGQYDKVDAAWQLGFSNACEMIKPLDVDKLLSPRRSANPINSFVPMEQVTAVDSDRERRESAHPSETSVAQNDKKKIIPSRRFLLRDLFNTYLLSLAYRGELSKVTETVHTLEAAGFALSSLNRSTIIEIFAESDEFADVAEAFKMFETLFMPNFISWRHMEIRQGAKPRNAPRGLYGLENPRVPEQSKKVLGKKAKLYWSNVDPGFLQPSYSTMVYLVAAMRRLRYKAIMDGTQDVHKLYDIAPTTLNALITMPRLRDKVQAVILGNHAPRRGTNARIARYPVRPGGILGRGIGARKKRPMHTLRNKPSEDALGPKGFSDPHQYSAEMREWFSMMGLKAANYRRDDMPGADDFDTSRLFDRAHAAEDWEKFLSLQDRFDLRTEIQRDQLQQIKGSQRRRRRRHSLRLLKAKLATPEPPAESEAHDCIESPGGIRNDQDQ